MASKYWIKLYHEILHDPKMGRLSDRLWRRSVELFLLAGEHDQDGWLPRIPDMAWTLRIEEQDLASDLRQLSEWGIVTQDGDGIWFVTKFADRQSPVSDAERKRQQRERDKKAEYYCHEPVTQPVTMRDIDTDTDTDTEGETEKDSFGAFAPASADNGGGNADYHEMRKAWSELFPKKPQPRAENQTLQGKVRTRMRSEHFRENWHSAMKRAARSTFCRDGPWFDFSWFVRNDDHYERCLTGRYDDNAPQVKQASGKDSADPQRFITGEYAEWVEH